MDLLSIISLFIKYDQVACLEYLNFNLNHLILIIKFYMFSLHNQPLNLQGKACFVFFPLELPGHFNSSEQSPQSLAPSHIQVGRTHSEVELHLMNPVVFTPSLQKCAQSVLSIRSKKKNEKMSHKQKLSVFYVGDKRNQPHLNR